LRLGGELGVAVYGNRHLGAKPLANCQELIPILGELLTAPLEASGTMANTATYPRATTPTT